MQSLFEGGRGMTDRIDSQIRISYQSPNAIIYSEFFIKDTRLS